VNRPARVLSALVATACSAGVVAVAGPALAHDHHDHQPASADRLTAAEERVVLKATYRLQTPKAAIAAGYLPTTVCTELPGVGGMGYHYLNPTLAADDVIDPSHPEVLVFVPAGHGRLRLGAAEYFKADADQDLATSPDRPSLFGRHPFEGPMLGHEPGMPIHFDKHVWLYAHNPAGELEPWNPRVHCPAT
jgi:hypothetical protein